MQSVRIFSPISSKTKISRQIYIKSTIPNFAEICPIACRICMYNIKTSNRSRAGYMRTDGHEVNRRLSRLRERAEKAKENTVKQAE